MSCCMIFVSRLGSHKPLCSTFSFTQVMFLLKGSPKLSEELHRDGATLPRDIL